MFDSGYQLITKYRQFTLEETIEIYRLAKFRKGDFGIALDYCPHPYGFTKNQDAKDLQFQ